MSISLEKWSKKLLMATAMTAFVPLGALAADTSEPTMALEEILVTARKKVESLTDAPLSISTFSEEQIKAAGITNIRDMSGFAPGLVVIDAGGNGAGGRAFGQIYIRPLPPTLPHPRAQTGALFIDGIHVSGSVSSIDMSDVERVEVIKGPQSALFGRNTFGGAINFITRKPGNEFAASIDASASSRSSFNTAMSVEGPLVEDILTARLTARIYDKSGHYRANDGGKLGDESSKSVALTVVATPTDALSIRLRGSYIHDLDGPSQETMLGGNLYGDRCPGGTFNAATNSGTPVSYTGFSVNHFCGTIPSLGKLGEQVVSSNTTIKPPFLSSIGIPNKLLDMLGGRTPELNNNALYLRDLLEDAPSLSSLGMKRDIIRLSTDLDYTFENDMSLSLIVGYNDTNQITAYDKDHTDTENLWSVQPTRYKDFFAEARVNSATDTKFRWSVGASYSDFSFLTQELQYDIRRQPTQPISKVASINSTTGEEATVLGVFASLEYDILEKLTLTLEGRYQEDKSDVAPFRATQGLAPAETFKFKSWLPRAILRYKPEPNTTTYVSYSVGSLPGQGNAQYMAGTDYQREQIKAQFPGISEITPAQKLNNYEIGLKQRVFDGRLEYSVSAYYMQWKNIFNSGIVTTPTSATDPTPRIFNSIFVPGDADLWGLEFEAAFQITPNLTGRLSGSWQDNKYKTVFATSTTYAQGYVRFDGNEIPRIPDMTGALSLTYRDSLTDKWDWYVRGDGRYYGKAYDAEANTAQFNDYVRFNARIGFERDDMTVEFFGNNIFNNKDWDFGFRNTSQGEPGYSFGPAPLQSGVIARAADKREIGVRLSVKY